jgi:hypothetical protein
VNHQPRGSEPSAQVDTITRNTVFSFAASMSTAAFTALLTLYLPIAIGALALNAAIDVILIPKMGVLGAAVGTDVGFAVYLAAHVRLSHQVFGLPLKPLAATSARSLVGAGALAVVLALMGTGSLSAVEWILGLAAGAVVFLTTLVLTGELSRSDAQAMWSLPKKVLRSG